MNLGTYIKWGAIAVAVYFAWKLINNAIDAANYTPSANDLSSPTWAAPIWYGGPVTGWYAPWQRPYRPRSGRGRGR